MADVVNTNMAAIRIAKNRMDGVPEDRELAGGHRVDRARRELDVAGHDGRRRGPHEEQDYEDDPADELQIRLEHVTRLVDGCAHTRMRNHEPQECDARERHRDTPTVTGEHPRREL